MLGLARTGPSDIVGFNLFCQRSFFGSEKTRPELWELRAVGNAVNAKTALGSPGAELSTWTTFQFFSVKQLYTDTRCVTALQSYTAIQRYTALYIIQLYIAIHYTPSTTPLGAIARRAVGSSSNS